MRTILGPLLLASLLAAPAAAQERPDAAALFPGDTIAYAEVDAGALARGLPELQLVKMLSDERLQAFFKPPLDTMGLDAADVAGSLLRKSTVREWLAGKAALGIRGLAVTIVEPDGKRKVLRVSPDRPFDAETATQLFGALARLEMGAGLSGRFALDLMAVVEPGPKLKEAVRAFLAQPNLPLGQEKVTVGGREVLHLTLRPDDAAFALFTMPFIGNGIYADLSGDRWIVASDKETMASALQGGPRGALAGSPGFAKARARLTGGHALAFAYVDAAALVRTVKPCIPPIVFDLCERNGIAAIEGAGAGISISEGGVRESFGVMLDGRLRGAWTLLEALPGGMRSLEVSPPGALAVVGFKFDGTKLRERVGAVLKDLALVTKDEEVSAMLRQAARGALDLEKDILPAFGDEAALFVFPPQMGPVPQAVLGIDLRDEAAFRKLLVQAQQAAAAGGVARFAPLDLGEGIEAVQVFAPLPMSLCFAVHKKHFFAASSPELLKQVLLEWGSGGAKSLRADDEVFRSTLKGLNGESVDNLAALGYVNLRAAVPQVVALLPMLGTQLPPGWIDRTQVPDFNRLAKHLTGAAVGLRVDGDGVTLDAFSPAGLILPGTTWAVYEEQRRMAEWRARQAQVILVEADTPTTGIRTRSLQGDHVRIDALQEDGAASRAGLKAGDVVLAIDGVPVRGIEEMDKEVSRRAPGDEVTLTIRRGEETIEIVLRLEAGDR